MSFELEMDIGEAGELWFIRSLANSLVRSCIRLCHVWASHERGAELPKKRTGSWYRRNMESYGDHTSQPGGMGGTAGKAGPKKGHLGARTITSLTLSN